MLSFDTEGSPLAFKVKICLPTSSIPMNLLDLPELCSSALIGAVLSSLKSRCDSESCQDCEPRIFEGSSSFRWLSVFVFIFTFTVVRCIVFEVRLRKLIIYQCLQEGTLASTDIPWHTHPAFSK